MAEESDLERTEPASQRRLEQAREQGQVPHSRELGTFLVLLAGVAGLYAMSGWIGRRSADLLRQGLSLEHKAAFDPQAMFATLWSQSSEALVLLAPLFLLLVVSSFVSPMLLGGFVFSSKSFAPDFTRLSLMAGLKRMVSMNGLVELGNAVAKAAVGGGVGAWVVWRSRHEVFHLAVQPLETALPGTGSMVLFGALLVVASMALIVALDVPYQLWHYHAQMKMTREELRQEAKESDGDPHVKARIRAQQREMAQKRMMAEVPKADVVVTNPTRFAVALQYQSSSQRAPKVVAKGTDLVAARIREIAAEHKVPLLEAPPLARA